MTLDKKGIQNAIKFGMSREQIAKQYGLECIDDAIKRIYPHNYIDMLRKIDKNTDKRKSAKRQSEIAIIREKLKEGEEEMAKTEQKPKTELEKLEEQKRKVENTIIKTEIDLETQLTELADTEKLQSDKATKIDALRKALEEECHAYAMRAEKIEEMHKKALETESELAALKTKLEGIATKITTLTKVIIEITASNKIIAWDTQLDYTGYETKLFELATCDDLIKVSFGAVTTLAKILVAVEKIGKEKVILKFESKKLKELYEKISN